MITDYIKLSILCVACICAFMYTCPSLYTAQTARELPILGQDVIALYESDVLANAISHVFQNDSGLIDYIRRSWLRGPSNGKRQLNNPQSYDYSEYQQSIYIDNLLRNKTRGFYIECGAAEGETNSNTLFFEKERKWSGLLVEANPDFYRDLMKKHRHAYTINSCLSPSRYPMRTSFMSSSWLGGLDQKMVPDHSAYLQVSGLDKRIYVQCFPLYSILQAIGVYHIDYFSLDVEGAEIDILKTIPFDKVKIDILSLEYGVYDGDVNVAKGQKMLLKFRNYLKTLGMYEEVGPIGPVDVVWKRKDVDIDLSLVNHWPN